MKDGSDGTGVDPRPRRDPGLQPERTQLAWRRTTLTCTVATALAGKAALPDAPGPIALLTCALFLFFWLVFLAVAHQRIRALTTATPRLLAPRLATAAVLCTVALALCAVPVLV